MDKSLKIALGSLGVSLVVPAVKFTAYLNTGSLAPYSDALESIINVATSIAAIIAIRIAARPADAGHPYGYHKAEYMSAVVIGGRGNLRQCHRCYRSSCLANPPCRQGHLRRFRSGGFRDMSVSRAHETCDWLETAIKKVLAGAVVTIHVEPEHKAKHSGILVL